MSSGDIRPIRPEDVKPGQVVVGVRWRAPYATEATVVLVDASSMRTDADKLEAARHAIEHLLVRIEATPKLAWYFDSATRSFLLLTEAHALLNGLDRYEVQRTMATRMQVEPPDVQSNVHAVNGALVRIAERVAELGEYRELVQRMAQCLPPHERAEFETLLRFEAKTAVERAMVVMDED